MAISRAGEWAFLVFVIIAILVGLARAAFVFDTFAITLILVILGIIVGFLNITEKETSAFLIAALALLVAGTANFEYLNFGQDLGIGTAITNILSFIGAFVAPAAVIVGLKAIYALGRQK